MSVESTPAKPTPEVSSTLNRAILRSALRQSVRQSREARFLHRLHCVLLLSEGMKVQEVATWFGEHPRTLDRWKERYTQQGVAGLKEGPSTGRPPKIPREQMPAIARDIASPPSKFGYNARRWQGKLLKEHLESRYQVELSLRHCQRLLKEVRNNPNSRDLDAAIGI